MKLKFAENARGTAQPDPYVIRAEDGFYYLYATGEDGVGIFRAPSLGGVWDYLGKAFNDPEHHAFWAPCVVYENGVYYMYYSSCKRGCGDMHEQKIKVATSSRPDGGFVYRNTVLPPFSIDAHVVKSGGEYYIFYSLNDYEGERAGTYIAVDRMKDMFTAEGNPVAVVRPTLDEEIFQKNRFRQGQHWHTVEGAFYFRRGDHHFLMYSGNCYLSPYYFIGYAHAYGKEDDLRKLRFEKYPHQNEYAPLLARGEEEEGTGHNSLAEENGKLYIIYHGRDKGTPAGEEETRTARYLALTAEGNRLVLSAPRPRNA